MGAVVVVTLTSEGDYLTARRVSYGTLHLSSSYSAGGDTFTAGQFGFESINFMTINPGLNPSSTTASIVLSPSVMTTTGAAAAGKIQAFWSNTSATFLAEASGDLSAYIASFMIIGW